MTTEQWVHRINAIARRLDAACEGVHPSAWAGITERDRAEYKRLAATPTKETV